MKIFAVSDLHLSHATNREAVQALSAYPGDWLILAGDVGETEAQLRFALVELGRRFARLIWVPGNHDLWSLPVSGPGPRGKAKYDRLVAICREHGVLTPEDPYARFTALGRAYRIVPMFLLYDYSFCPPGMDVEAAVRWARQTGVICMDERVLSPDPYPSRSAWCAARCRITESRLAELGPDEALILVNHFPLLQEHARLPAIPRFSVWCGTTRTADWHRRFPVSIVVYGHLHIRRTTFRNGVRFEEVSLGYPRQWRQERGLAPYLRQILPAPGFEDPDDD